MGPAKSLVDDAEVLRVGGAGQSATDTGGHRGDGRQPGLGEGAGEDVGAMVGAVHPRGDDLRWRVEAGRAGRDVLADLVAGAGGDIAHRLQALYGCRTARRDV